MSVAGIEAEEIHSVEGNWSSASGAQAAEKLIEQFPGLDAVFVANDQMALSVIQVVHEKGIRIPEDIGIAGFDNIPESAFFLPSLTTVQQDQDHVAKLAVEEMIKIIDSGWQELEPIEPQNIMLPRTLVVRQSSLRQKERGIREVSSA